MEAFTREQVVPDVVDSVPKSQLQVSYGGATVNPGNNFTPTQVKDKPEVTWAAEENAFYTVLLTDPDAPSRANPISGEFLHCLVVNIPGNDVNKGTVLVEYVGSGAPKGTGLHRYTFLLFKQPGRQEFPDFPRIDRVTRAGRPKFRTRDFAARFGLGDPQAGTFFLAEYDDYVPTVHKQLGIQL